MAGGGDANDLESLPVAAHLINSVSAVEPRAAPFGGGVDVTVPLVRPGPYKYYYFHTNKILVRAPFFHQITCNSDDYSYHNLTAQSLLLFFATNSACYKSNIETEKMELSSNVPRTACLAIAPPGLPRAQEVAPSCWAILCCWVSSPPPTRPNPKKCLSPSKDSYSTANCANKSQSSETRASNTPAQPTLILNTDAKQTSPIPSPYP